MAVVMSFRARAQNSMQETASPHCDRLGAVGTCRSAVDGHLACGGGVAVYFTGRAWSDPNKRVHL
jgi:hypothetical protein